MENSPVRRKTPNKQIKPQLDTRNYFLWRCILGNNAMLSIFSVLYIGWMHIEDLVYSICGVHNVFDLTKCSISSPLCYSLALRIYFHFQEFKRPMLPLLLSNQSLPSFQLSVFGVPPEKASLFIFPPNHLYKHRTVVKVL